MNYLGKDNTNLRIGIGVSIGLHLAIMLIFLLIQIKQNPLLPAAEVTFIAGRAGAAAGHSMISPKPEDSAPAPASARPARSRKQTTADAGSRREEKPVTQKTVPVSPPKRRMLEDEQPILASRSDDKLNPAVSAPTNAAEAQSNTASAGGRLSENQDGAMKTGSSQKGGTGGGGGQPFTIEGDAAQRMIVNQVIPAYPEGLQREAVIKFRFTVLPDGRMTNILPVIKGDPQLERITIQALSKWRFNALPSEMEQTTVQGLITFRYELH